MCEKKCAIFISLDRRIIQTGQESVEMKIMLAKRIDFLLGEI